MTTSSHRAFAKLAVSLALAGCADGEFEHGVTGSAETMSQVVQAVTGQYLKYRLERIAGPVLDACDPLELCPANGPCSISNQGKILHVTGDLSFPAERCTFTGQVRIEAPGVDLDCRGSVIDARGVDWQGIGNSGTRGPTAAHENCETAAQLPVREITISNCTVKYSKREGISFSRDLGQVRLNPNTCTSEPAAFFGESVGGMHYPPYKLPEYLRSELSPATQSLLNSPTLTDAQVMDILRELGPQNIVLDNVTLLFNQRSQLYVRQHTSDFTMKSSLLVQSPDGLPLECWQNPNWSCNPDQPEYFSCEETSTWVCGAPELSNQERLLCEALTNACKEDTRFTVYVDRESRRTSIFESDFRQSMSVGPYPEAEAPADVDVPGPKHLALDSTANNQILANTFSGKANAIFAFKNCGENDSYRFQHSEGNVIAGNVFALAPEATAVWLGQRQGARYNGNASSPLNCFRAGESYPWLTLPQNELPNSPPPGIHEYTRYFMTNQVVYDSLSAQNYCRQELPPQVGCREDDADCPFPTPLFFDFATNNDLQGNWFFRQQSAMPSVILWEGTHQVANRAADNFTNFDQHPGTDPTMAMVCRRNGFLDLDLVDLQRPDDASGVSRLEPPTALSDASVAQLHMALSALF